MFKRQENQLLDQTKFIEQAPLLEKTSLGLFAWQNLKNNRNLWPFLALAGSLIFIFFLLLLKSLRPNNNLPAPEMEQKEIVRTIEHLQSRVEELKTTLKANNPTKQNLPFPQVDLEFNIN